jgi:hypothetical protein
VGKYRRGMTKCSPFRYFKTSPKIIRMAVMLYVRFPLSLPNVEIVKLQSFGWNAFGGLFLGGKDSTPLVIYYSKFLMRGRMRSPPCGCIFHSDCNSQYFSHDYQKIEREHGFKASMSGKGNFYDNAVIKTFFKTIKAELIWRRSWEMRRQVETAIFQYINGFYNSRRRH